MIQLGRCPTAWSYGRRERPTPPSWPSSTPVHADDTIPGEALAEWTLELFEIPPPGFRAEDDVIVVEDTGSGRIVSSLCLIPQTWSYAGVPTSVGQPSWWAPIRTSGGGG